MRLQTFLYQFSAYPALNKANLSTNCVINFRPHIICGRMFKFELKLDVDSLICPLGHFESDGHTIHKFSQRRLTADWLVPCESDCSHMHSKDFSDWLPSCIKVTRRYSGYSKWLDTFQSDPVHVLMYCIQRDYVSCRFRNKHWNLHNLSIDWLC